MDLYSAIGFAAAAAITSFSVSRFNKTAARWAAIAAGAIISIELLVRFGALKESIRSLAEMGGIPSETLVTALKAVGIAYLTELTASFCRDLGENSLAVTCETAGRLMLTLLALPIVREIARIAIGIADSIP